MRLAAGTLILGSTLLARSVPGQPGSAVAPPGPGQAAAQQQVDLVQSLAAGRLRAVNRDVSRLAEPRDGVHVSERAGNGVVWVEGSDFGEGTIELDVRGRDVFQRSFLGVAFHRTDDSTYEAVYVRPFNFRPDDPARRPHAVQYISLPDHDWARLRKEFPEQFERQVDASVAPTEWVPLRIVVKGPTIQVFVGHGPSPTLEVRKLGRQDRGMVGLWTGNTSDGDFANLRITPAK